MSTTATTFEKHDNASYNVVINGRRVGRVRKISAANYSSGRSASRTAWVATRNGQRLGSDFATRAEAAARIAEAVSA